MSIPIAKLRRLIADGLYRLLGSRPLPQHLSKGPNWVSITHSLAKHLVSKEQEMWRLYKHTRSCDEIFLQTELRASQGELAVKISSLGAKRYVDWSKGGPSPKTLTMEDAPRLLESDALFARKFSSEVDKELIDLICQRASTPPQAEP